MAKKKLSVEAVKAQLLESINFVFTNNGARSERANEIRSYEINDNKITGVFVGVRQFKEELFEFEMTKQKDGWLIDYGYPDSEVAKNSSLHYFPENMKKQIHRYYRESNTALDECGVLVRPALLLTEGKITDSEGVTTTYTRELIDAIVETSNAYAQTEEIKLFNDHEYSQKSRIGSVTGKFTAREITDFDLPENSDRSSIGKYAVFNDGIEIRDEKAIEKYQSGLLKELSIGIILSGNTGTIYEVSAVPWGAVKEAHIYSGEPMPIDDDIHKYAFSFEAEMRKGSMPSEEQMMAMDKTWKGFYSFSNVLYELQNATDSELPKPRSKMTKKALDDLNGYLYSIHLPKPDPEEIPIVMMEKPMTEKTKTYSAADFEALQSQLAKLQKDNQDTLKFSALKDKASELVRNGKLSPAEYKTKFEGDQAFANYQAAIAGDPLESFLNYLDAHVTPDPRLAPSVYGATPLLNQEVPERPEAEQKAVKDRASAIPVTKVSY
ncbi:hypothetical protein [Phormidium tenue]|uniref:Uncharacterized protein n=1 Tax=Phormidium tenue FACHB-1050 TaxID=2692857 RepID=A0ABR8C8I5_9CYAN|nr:hypothetical protein [Phormidium tenue]MBD2316675.1 hypothetical protein [Phormidium tenue FACHB-1050]